MVKEGVRQLSARNRWTEQQQNILNSLKDYYRSQRVYRTGERHEEGTDRLFEIVQQVVNITWSMWCKSYYIRGKAVACFAEVTTRRNFCTDFSDPLVFWLKVFRASYQWAHKKWKFHTGTQNTGEWMIVMLVKTQAWNLTKQTLFEDLFLFSWCKKNMV